MYCVIVPEKLSEIFPSSFLHCTDLTAIYFEGDTISLPDSVFSSKATIYYIPGKSGWTTPLWKGYHTAPWDGNKDAAPTIALTETDDNYAISVELPEYSKSVQVFYILYDDKDKMLSCGQETLEEGAVKTFEASLKKQYNADHVKIMAVDSNTTKPLSFSQILYLK